MLVSLSAEFGGWSMHINSDSGEVCSIEKFRGPVCDDEWSSLSEGRRKGFDWGSHWLHSPRALRFY